MGHGVTIFEALHKPGGVLMYGIPEFRLPKSIVEREIDALQGLGVEIRPNHVIGQHVHGRRAVSEQGFDAVFIGHRRRASLLPGDPGREPDRRLLRQRVPDAVEPDAGVQVPRDRHADHARAARGGDRRREHGDGLGAHGAPAGRRARVPRVSPLARTRCPRGPRKSSTPGRKASRSSCWPRRWRSWATSAGGCARSGASAWRSASPTRPDGAARWRFRAPSSTWRWTWWCSRSARAPTRSSARRRPI